MQKALTRILKLLLIPCLLADPSWAVIGPFELPRNTSLAGNLFRTQAIPTRLPTTQKILETEPPIGLLARRHIPGIRGHRRNSISEVVDPFGLIILTTLGIVLADNLGRHFATQWVAPDLEEAWRPLIKGVLDYGHDPHPNASHRLLLMISIYSGLLGGLTALRLLQPNNKLTHLSEWSSYLEAFLATRLGRIGVGVMGGGFVANILTILFRTNNVNWFAFEFSNLNAGMNLGDLAMAVGFPLLIARSWRVERAKSAPPEKLPGPTQAPTTTSKPNEDRHYPGIRGHRRGTTSEVVDPFGGPVAKGRLHARKTDRGTWPSETVRRTNAQDDKRQSSSSLPHTIQGFAEATQDFLIRGLSRNDIDALHQDLLAQGIVQIGLRRAIERDRSHLFYPITHKSEGLLSLKLVPIKSIGLKPTTFRSGFYAARVQRASSPAIPQVQRVLHFHQTQDLAWWVQEWVKGEALYDALIRGAEFSIPELRLITHDVLAGLQQLHERGLSDWDLKVSDTLILRDESKRITGAKIIDLGELEDHPHVWRKYIAAVTVCLRAVLGPDATLKTWDEFFKAEFYQEGLQRASANELVNNLAIQYGYTLQQAHPEKWGEWKQQLEVVLNRMFMKVHQNTFYAAEVDARPGYQNFNEVAADVDQLLDLLEVGLPASSSPKQTQNFNRWNWRKASIYLQNVWFSLSIFWSMGCAVLVVKGHEFDDSLVSYIGVPLLTGVLLLGVSSLLILSLSVLFSIISERPVEQLSHWVLNESEKKNISREELGAWILETLSLNDQPAEFYDRLEKAGLLPPDLSLDPNSKKFKRFANTLWQNVRGETKMWFPPSEFAKPGMLSQKVQIGSRRVHILGIRHGSSGTRSNVDSVRALVWQLERSGIPLYSEQNFPSAYLYSYGVEMDDHRNISLLALITTGVLSLALLPASILFNLIIRVTKQPEANWMIGSFLGAGARSFISDARTQRLAQRPLDDTNSSADIAVLVGAGHVQDMAAVYARMIHFKPRAVAPPVSTAKQSQGIKEASALVALGSLLVAFIGGVGAAMVAFGIYKIWTSQPVQRGLARVPQLRINPSVQFLKSQILLAAAA